MANAVQVPERQAVRLHVKMMAPLAVLQWISVRHQVAAHPIGVDHLHDPGLLGDLVLVEAADVLCPADRLVGNAQRAEDVVVEAVLAKQQRAAEPGTGQTALPG